MELGQWQHPSEIRGSRESWAGGRELLSVDAVEPKPKTLKKHTYRKPFSTLLSTFFALFVSQLAQYE